MAGEKCAGARCFRLVQSSTDYYVFTAEKQKFSIFSIALCLHLFFTMLLHFSCILSVPASKMQQMQSEIVFIEAGIGCMSVRSRQRITVALSIGINEKKNSKRICRCRTFVRLLATMKRIDAICDTKTHDLHSMAQQIQQRWQ